MYQHYSDVRIKTGSGSVTSRAIVNDIIDGNGNRWRALGFIELRISNNGAVATEAIRPPLITSAVFQFIDGIISVARADVQLLRTFIRFGGGAGGKAIARDA